MQTTYCRMLGISNAGLANDRVDQLKDPSTFTDTGLFGSDANIAPDEYLYNYCVSVTNPSAIIPDGHMAVQLEGSGQNWHGKAIEVEVNGEKYNMPNEVYAEVNMLTGVSATDSAAASTSKTWGEWVELENQRNAADRPKTGTYAPSYITFGGQGGGTYKLVSSIYGMAKQADSIISDSVDENGNSKYKTRYATGANTVSIAEDFEDISKGTEYYVLSKVASGDIEKSTVAVVCGYDPNSHNFAVRVLNPGVDNDKDANMYGGRLASAVNPIANDITTLGLETQQEAYSGEVADALNRNREPLNETLGSTYVRWYSAEQIIENCDAVFLSDAPANNGISAYLAADTQGKQYAPTSEDAVADLTKAQEAAKAANAEKVADVCAKYPACMFQNFYAQGAENVMLNFITASYLYPEYFNLTDTMAWWAKHLWHITDGSLQDIIDSTCYDISLSTNQTQIGTYSSDYESKINDMIGEGNAYYCLNKETVDAIADGNIATYDYNSLLSRSVSYITQAVNDAQQAVEDAQTDSAAKQAAAAKELEEAQAKLAEAQSAQAAATQEATAAKAAQTTAEKEASEAKQQAADAASAATATNTTAAATTVTVNKSTVKASDISSSATTVVLGAKTKKISASAFKGSSAKTVIILSKNLKKAKVKNCFKGSKVKTVQVPGSKYAAYKKILTKKITGKKVTLV